MHARPVEFAARSVLLNRVVDDVLSKSFGQLISTELCFSEPKPDVCISADIPSKTRKLSLIKDPSKLPVGRPFGGEYS